MNSAAARSVHQAFTLKGSTTIPLRSIIVPGICELKRWFCCQQQNDRHRSLWRKTVTILTVLLRLVRDERKQTYILLRVVNRGAALHPEESAFKQGQD
ncbi:hypothetical protein C162_22023 [Paenibacillus sp. FSL R7-269]|nr:hypothetical protein C162_22023 [Paenibacillus sp. FSL R7-269]